MEAEQKDRLGVKRLLAQVLVQWHPSIRAVKVLMLKY